MRRALLFRRVKVSCRTCPRSVALKLQNAQTAESAMAFEKTAPAGTDTTFHPLR
jgi:hypothetical protein